MLGLRSAAREDTPVSPSQAVFGLAVCLPGQLSQEPEMDLVDFLKQMQLTFGQSGLPPRCPSGPTCTQVH